ncbi:MAG: AEC family transporter [Christensenellales bacterium]|jgi:predicted permease
MGAAFAVVLEQMGVFLLLIGVGAIGALLKILSPDSLHALSSFALHFSIPCLIFSTLAGSITQEQLLLSWPLIALSLCISGLMFCFGLLSARLCKLSGNRRRIHLCQSTFGNLGMIGIPLITALFGAGGMLPLTAFLLCDQTLLWTVGIRLGYPKESAAGFAWKRLLNPILLSAVLGISFALLGIRLPGAVAETIEGLGATTKYISLIFVGGTLIFSARERRVRSPGPLGIVLFKMLVCPIAVFFGLRLAGWVDAVTACTLAAIAGLPAMGTLAVVAKASGSDDAYASTVTLVTTIFAAVTLPALIWVFGLLPF